MQIRTLSLFLAIALLAAGKADADPRWHHRGFGSYYRNPGFSFYLGVPWYPRPYFSDPFYYPYSYPYYPPVVTVPTEPPVYIERDQPQTQQFPSGYWYYCSNPEGYYPYVQECPTGWRQVAPAPPR